MTMTMMMKMVMMTRVLSLVLLLGRGLRHLALQDLLPLLVHVALHAGEGVVPHLAQVRLQVLLLRVVCVATQKQRVRGTRTIRTTSSASPPGSADPGAAPWGHLPPPRPPFWSGLQNSKQTSVLLGHVRPVKYGKSRFVLRVDGAAQNRLSASWKLSMFSGAP